MVLDAARAVKAGTAGPETENLVARLEKVTGTGIAELGNAVGLAAYVDDVPTY